MQYLTNHYFHDSFKS